MVGAQFDDEFADFVRRWSPALLRVAFLLTSDRGEAEDLLQTALLKTARHWGRLADREAAYPYVRRVFVTTHTSWRRRRRVHEVLVDELPERYDEQPAVLPGRALRALDELPPRMRAEPLLDRRPEDGCRPGIGRAGAAGRVRGVGGPLAGDRGAAVQRFAVDRLPGGLQRGRDPRRPGHQRLPHQLTATAFRGGAGPMCEPPEPGCSGRLRS